MRRVRRALLVLPVLAILSWMSVIAIDAGQASLIVSSVNEKLAAWSRPVGDLKSWAGMRADLAGAAALGPGDPGIQELLGALKSLRPDHADSLQEAVVHFRKSLEQRPGSPSAWASLLKIRYELGAAGSDLEPYFDRMVLLGPAEPPVQRAAIDVGLAVWSEVGGSSRASIERMVAAAGRRNPLETLHISERRGRLDVACRYITDSARTPEARWLKLCQSTEATP